LPKKEVEVLYLLLKYGKNGARRLAGLEIRCEWMEKNIVFCLLFVGFQGIIENKLKVRGRGASWVSLRHESGGNSEVFVRAERKMADSQVSRKRNR